jgi:DNA invertase Pin-like site-specific DNA recombinase
MLIGYMRVSKSDGTQTLDLQCDALLAAGVAPEQIYADRASGRKDDRPGLATGALGNSYAADFWR